MYWFCAGGEIFPTSTLISFEFAADSILGGHFSPEETYLANSPQRPSRHLGPSPYWRPPPLPGIFNEKSTPPPYTRETGTIWQIGAPPPVPRTLPSSSPNRKNKKYPKRPPRITQRAQRSKKIEISSGIENISCEIEIFKRATHRGPIFGGEIETSRSKFSSLKIKNFDRDRKFRARLNFFDRWALWAL